MRYEILEELIRIERYALENTHGKNRTEAIKEYRRLRRLREKGNNANL